MNYQFIFNCLSIIIPTITSFVILFFTLRAERKQSAIFLDNLRSQFEKRLKRDGEYYQNQLYISEENSRISNRPYLLLSKEISTVPKKINGTVYEHIQVCLRVTNIGNGMAENIIIHAEEYGGRRNCICKPEIYSEGTIEFIYDDHLSINVLCKNDSAAFGLSRYVILSEEYKEKGSEWINGPSWVVIAFNYEDSFDNKYEQKCRFLMNGKGEFFRVETDKPELKR